MCCVEQSALRRAVLRCGRARSKMELHGSKITITAFLNETWSRWLFANFQRKLGKLKYETALFLNPYNILRRNFNLHSSSLHFNLQRSLQSSLPNPWVVPTLVGKLSGLERSVGVGRLAAEKRSPESWVGSGRLGSNTRNCQTTRTSWQQRDFLQTQFYH